jgi:DHA2 family multidrug resistance protein
MAWNLQALLLFRVLQGFGGGGMVPVAQSILADSFPPAKRGQAFALFGVAVVVAPAVGPTLGGWLSDNVSWQSCFLINGPVGALSMVLVYMLVKEARPGRGVRFDWGGFILVAAFLGALEFILDRGQQDDWFGSNFIITCACISGLAVLAGRDRWKPAFAHQANDHLDPHPFEQAKRFLYDNGFGRASRQFRIADASDPRSRS